MKKEEILKMEAGREMDALVAEGILKFYIEWHWCKQDPECGDWYPVEYKSEDEIKKEIKENWYKPEKHPCCRFEDPQTGEFRAWEIVEFYSTDISAAWEVVEKMDSCLHLKEHDERGGWEAFFCGANETAWKGKGETAPLAICRAALLAEMEEK